MLRSDSKLTAMSNVSESDNVTPRLAYTQDNDIQAYNDHNNNRSKAKQISSNCHNAAYTS